MKFFKKIFLIIVTFLVTISLATLFIGCPPKPTEEIIEKTIEEVTTTEEAELKTEEEAEETKNYELDFIGAKRLKKEFGDSLLRAFISIDENNEEEFTEQMKKIDDILTELETYKKIGVHEEVEELYDLFIEDIKTTVDMLIAEFYKLEEYEELHKNVIELDEKFLNEYHIIEDKLKE